LPPVQIFFSYAHEDEELMNSVREQLVIYERLGRIVKWHDRQIPPGDEWEGAIDQRLQHCHLILLLVSPAFLKSRYCWDVEVQVALARHARQEARVVPIILRPCPWHAAPFASLQALPRDGKPLSQWPDRDQACLDIAEALMAVVGEITQSATQPPPIGPHETQSNGVERAFLEGDRIARLMVSFKPPAGSNIPFGYQRRLNFLASEAAREAAARQQDGSYRFPVHVKGPPDNVRNFATRVATLGQIEKRGNESGSKVSELWFEYVGQQAPRIVKQCAAESELQVIQCGATLLV
jgi:hypothetical protein